jgi:hypothetical protein
MGANMDELQRAYNSWNHLFIFSQKYQRLGREDRSLLEPYFQKLSKQWGEASVNLDDRVIKEIIRTHSEVTLIK